MTKKDFDAFARRMRETKPDPATSGDAWRRVSVQWSKDVSAVVKVLADSNPRFDRERFWAEVSK